MTIDHVSVYRKVAELAFFVPDVLVMAKKE
jgi:hypothetical protein